MALIANMPNSERNSSNFPFGNTTNNKMLHKTGAKGKLSQIYLPQTGIKLKYIDFFFPMDLRKHVE